MPFTGVLIEESLEDKSVLSEVRTLWTKIVPANKRHRTPWLDHWTMRAIEVPPERADEIADKLSRALEASHPWYADFNTEREHYVIFHGKIFHVEHRCREGYEPVVRYGLEQGIPAHQLDFLPHSQRAH